jgi:hypothetical protein
MAFNPIQNFQQGFSGGQQIRQQQQQNKITGLQNALAGQVQQGGFDPSSSVELQQLAALDPNNASRILSTYNGLSDSRKSAAFNDARKGIQLLEGGDGSGFLNLLSDRISNVERLGGDPSGVKSVLDTFVSGDIEGTLNQLRQTERIGMIETDSRGNPFLQDLTPKGDEGKVTANIADFLFHEKLIKSGKQEEADAFANKAGLSKLSPQEQAQLTLETAGLKQREKERTTRLGGFVNSGVGAADGVKNIRRSLELLKTVKTGGFDKAALAAKQMFGIESADEGELSNNLGTNVLSQLKTIFGSAFTEKEGLRLERLEAGIGKSPAANKRILEKALEMTTRAAKRGGRAAKELGDDFAFKEIELALDDALNSEFKFSQQAQAADAKSTVAPVQSTKQQGFTSPSGIQFTVGG